MSSAGQPVNCLGWAARDESGFLSPFEFERRVVKNDDVSVKITHCGICYADVLYTRNRIGAGWSKYPMVPGHEIVGIVKEVGPNVTEFKVGDHVGVGTYVNSCRDCDACNNDLHVHCSKGLVTTYSSTDVDGSTTQGGYSQFIVTNKRYCYQIPESYPMELAAPLLCAGITVYTPMVHHKMNANPGKSLGVVGLGGLGHMAVKFGKAFGLKVTVLSTSKSKKDDVLTLLQADKFVLSSDKDQMDALERSLDFIVDTASGTHPLDSYMALLKPGGVLALVGAPPELKLNPISLLQCMRTISGSMVGGTRITQEMINFCAEHKIYPEVEVVPIQYVNEAFDRLEKHDVKYRFVIDVANSLN